MATWGGTAIARQLVIELVGKADKYTKSLDDAEKATRSFGDKVEGAGKKMSTFVSVPIIGFLGASTKAAMDDAAAQEHLATTLGNTVGNSKKLVAEVEAYIGKAMKASTFTDDELRPAFETLVTSTKDVEKSQGLLNIAMDVAAGKGISLETATNAVAKAQDGNFAAVNRLVPGLIDLNDKTLTADGAVAQLASTFDNQATAATETTAGKMKNLTRDLGEASEKIGGQLLPVVTDFADFATGTLIPALDKLTGDNGAFALLGIAAAGPVLTNIGKLKAGVVALKTELAAVSALLIPVLGAIDLYNDFKQVEKGGGSLGDQAKGYLNALLGGGGEKGIFGKDFLGLRADGGPVSAGGAYIVGEKGPEIFAPGRSGQIIPNGGGGGGAQTIVVKIGDREIGRVVADALRQNALIGVS